VFSGREAAAHSSGEVFEGATAYKKKDNPFMTYASPPGVKGSALFELLGGGLRGRRKKGGARQDGPFACKKKKQPTKPKGGKGHRVGEKKDEMTGLNKVCFTTQNEYS